LRKGGSTGFASNSQAIVGDTGVTQLGVYGCLAYDTGNDRLYAARHDTDSGLSGNPVLAFRPATFNPGYQVAPDATLSGPANLRILAHGGQKDWLVGALSGGTNTLWVWKGPSSGDSPKSLTLSNASGGSVQLLGLALDGSD
jgi:hypothetical protein